MDKFKKNIAIAMAVYFLMALKGKIRHVFFKASLRTGERKRLECSVDEHTSFCLKTFDEMGFAEENFVNALEIGPGDNTSLAEALQKRKGCSITLIDKFQRPARNASIEGDERIRLLEYSPTLMASLALDGKEFDLIYSVSVLEHLWPWEKNLEQLLGLLAPNGVMYHIVNFTDHGLFTPFHDPLLFRRIPRALYEVAMRPVGRPNRVLPSQFMRFFEDRGCSVTMRVKKTHTRLLSNGDAYSLDRIPREEQEAAMKTYSGRSDQSGFILDQCIGSALLKVTKSDA